MTPQTKKKIFTLVLPAIAAIMLLIMIQHLMEHSKPKSRGEALPIPESSFNKTVAGTGVIESNNENISIATNIPGVVTEIYVREGQKVQKDAPLFLIDPRETQTQLKTAEVQLEYDKIALANVKSQLGFYEKVTNTKAISIEQLTIRQYNVRLAEVQVDKTQAQIDQLKTTLDRLTVRAPITGEILEVNIRLGEYASTGVLNSPLMRMGDTSLLNVRVQIDESDSARFTSKAKAYGLLSGQAETQIPLTFVRYKPFLLPKKNLTGDAKEIIDTRILEVIYSFDNANVRAFVGQKMDVFIDANTEETPNQENSKEASNPSS